MILKEDSNETYRTLQLLSRANNIGVNTIEQILNPNLIQKPSLEDPNFHRLVLGVAENVLSLSQFENFNEILRFYLSLDESLISGKVPAIHKSTTKLADTFFTSVKSKSESEMPYADLLIVYDNLIELLVHLKDSERLMYISNSLLSLGSRYKQAKTPDNKFLEYWRRSVSIELDLEDKQCDKSCLLLKSERLCLALSEIGKVEEAFEIISDTIGFYSNRNAVAEKVKVEPLQKIWEATEVQRIFHLTSRLLIDAYPKVPIAFSNLAPEVEACTLEFLLEILSKSSRANKADVMVKLIQRIQKNLPLEEYPLRNLRVLHNFFKSAGISYEKYNPGITRILLDRITHGEYAQDMQLAYLSTSIISVTSLSLVVSSSIPSADQYMYINMAVQYMLESLNSKSNFSDDLVVDVEMLSYFLDLQGAHEKRAEFLRGAIKSSFYKDHRNLFSCFLQLDLINSLLSLGYTGPAVREFELIKKESTSATLKPVEQVWLALREADCSIAVCDLTTASLTFKKICTLIEADELLKMPLLAGRPASEDRQHFQNRATLFAEICLALAKLHIEEGNVEYGISHAQKAIKFLQGFLRKFQSIAPQASSLPLNYTWRMTSLLITCQTLTAMAYERLGILREACYYISEASKVSRASDCMLRLAAILAFESELNVRSNNVDQATTLLQECQSLINNLNLQDLNVLHYAYSAILSLQRQRLFLEENEYYTLSDKIFTDLKEKSANFSIKSITDEISRLSLSGKAENKAKGLFSDTTQLKPSISSVRTRKLRSVRSTTKSVNHSSFVRPNRKANTLVQLKPQALSSHPETSLSDIYGVEVVWNSIVRSQVYSLGLQNEVDGAIALLDEQYRSAGTRDSVLLNVARARNFYLLAKRDLDQDPVLAFVSDSAISIPSIKITKSVLNVYSKDKTYPQDAINNLVTAKNLLLDCISDMMVVCTVVEIVAVSNLLNSITVLISAISTVTEQITEDGVLLPFPSLVLQEISRGLTLSSDRAVVKLRNNDFSWPSHSDALIQQSEVFSASDLGKSELQEMLLLYKARFVDFLPPKWAAVSISVCSETGSLVLSRFEKNKDPFLLNLPLNRHNCRDANEEFFSFEHGLMQLHEIIELSNATASAKRTSTIRTKEERQSWWKERYELDQRLQELLHDAEYCWIGGFLGIFSTERPFSHLMEKFSKQFVNILRTHLPSRNWVMGGGRRRGAASKRGGNRKPVNKAGGETNGQAGLEEIEIQIDPKLFELFVGLGDPESIEDPGMLEDLAYFILDTLQFHGERNAYDEIEMDQFLVDIEELLKTYHVQASSMTEDDIKENSIEHIVLVLDKKSQAFPWESIPSLRQKSVTRVPSFTILENLLSQVSSDLNLVTNRDNNNCHYVLNPGKDLPRTQERFQSTFEAMSGWTGLTAKPPTEVEVSTMLEKGDVFVYMGHGGGQQYIRSAKIKGLARCCPTLLLGCSSGALEEAGDYEPWGTPVSYLVAGCPMLVANMWDVTDKDIDRFSFGMLERWGAFPASNPGLKTMSIGEAIKNSRDECNLKFLNGAAPIVYGLPLTLVHQ